MSFISCGKFTLPNGLRVVVAPDPRVPVVAASVHYDVGYRSEPEGRSGFAHLFEHLMFQGSESVPRLEHHRLIQGAGGSLNGFTMPDYTAFHDIVPAEALDRLLFLEADRMRAPSLTEDDLRAQVAVVKEEILSQVHSQPYGEFPAVKLRPLLFQKFENAHDGYGDFGSLEQATLDESAAFFDTFYTPGNAVLTLAGNITVDQAHTLVEHYFGDVPARPAPIRQSLDEPPPTSERRSEYMDRLAPMPAVAVGYRMPDPADVDDYLAHMVLIDVLTEGNSARLRRRLQFGAQPLVCKLGGGALADPFHSRNPDAFTIHAYLMRGAGFDRVLDAIDDELEQLAQRPPTAQEVAASTTRWTASVYTQLDNVAERALGLGLFELLHGQAERLLHMPDRLDALTPDAVSAAAKSLRSDNRAVLTVIPGGNLA